MEDVMKLIDLLVQKKIEGVFEWPKNYRGATQDGDNGVIYFFEGEDPFFNKGSDEWEFSALTKWANGEGCAFDINYLAEDYASSIVTKEKYEAALAASQNVEWDGVGLPPVGCKCSIEDPDGNWPIVWFHGVKKSGDEYIFEDSLGKLISAPPLVVIRPLRLEADKKRDEAIEMMIEAYFKAPPIDEPNEYDRLAMAQLYDAIAAGKIPHVNID